MQYKTCAGAIITITVLLCAIASSVSANTLAVYFDPIAESQCEVVTLGTPVELYVIYNNPSLSDIVAFEFGIQFSGNGIPLGATDACGNVIADLSQVSVTCGVAVPGISSTVLAVFEVILIESYAYISAVAATNPTPPFTSAWVRYEAGQTIELEDQVIPLAMDGGLEICEGVSNSVTSWSAIKSQFR